MHKDNKDDLRKLFVGLDKKVNVEGKGRIIPINFDNAATTPPFKRVMKKILETSEYYGSIARGDGKNHNIVVIYMKRVEIYLLNILMHQRISIQKRFLLQILLMD